MKSMILSSFITAVVMTFSLTMFSSRSARAGNLNEGLVSHTALNSPFVIRVAWDTDGVYTFDQCRWDRDIYGGRKALESIRSKIEVVDCRPIGEQTYIDPSEMSELNAYQYYRQMYLMLQEAAAGGVVSGVSAALLSIGTPFYYVAWPGSIVSGVLMSLVSHKLEKLTKLKECGKLHTLGLESTNRELERVERAQQGIIFFSLEELYEYIDELTTDDVFLHEVEVLPSE